MKFILCGFLLNLTIVYDMRAALLDFCLLACVCTYVFCIVAVCELYRVVARAHLECCIYKFSPLKTPFALCICLHVFLYQRIVLNFGLCFFSFLLFFFSRFSPSSFDFKQFVAWHIYLSLYLYMHIYSNWRLYAEFREN